MKASHFPPVPPPIYGAEIWLKISEEGELVPWIPAFVVPAIQNLVIEEEDDSNEGDYQLQRKAQREDASKADRCRGCPMWPELLCDRPDCRHAPRHGSRRE